jgi:phosphoserine phosphatase
MGKKRIPMALAYDFDGTLAPGNMQEHQFLPAISMAPEQFWQDVQNDACEHQADPILMYMQKMLREASHANVRVTKDDFKKKGENIKLFNGVKDWFVNINNYAKSKGVKLEHYLISSGNEEIFMGTPVAKEFVQIYASKFIFDHHGVATWPGLAVNYTTKTQYLFRINKGCHDISDNQTINQYIEPDKRAVPFKNIIFIGDGATDIPAFSLVKKMKGLSIAVYKPNSNRNNAKKYLTDKRVHAAVPADYSQGRAIDKIVKAQIDLVVARDTLQKNLKGAG